MVSSINFDRVEHALSTPAGWVELALVAGCLAVAWLIDRRVRLRTAAKIGVVRVGVGGVNRLLFPVMALVLLIVANVVFHRFRPTFFLSLALPLVVALAVIRMLVYALRGVFSQASWLGSSERAISFTVWGLVVLYFVGVLPEIADELEAISVPIGKSQVNLLSIGRAALVVMLSLSLALWISSTLEARLMGAGQLDSSLRAVAAKAVRAILLVVAVLFALQAIGFDLTLLSVFGGALGVGIGLGLQKLASNYIAGFTILLDRSVRLGDMITVDNRFGAVSKVTARYVVVRSLDGIEAIVPNETLVTTTVLNHSYSTRQTRVALPFQVSHDSDVERALALLVEAAQAQPRTLKAPNAPNASLIRFSDSGIDLELGLWINDPENGQGDLRSAINLAVWRAFKAHGIRIAFPQRQVRIVGDLPVPAGTGDPAPMPAGRQV
jgi:small-conductance mechanosensitive channel